MTSCDMVSADTKQNNLDVIDNLIYQINIKLINYIVKNNDKIDEDVKTLYTDIYLLQHLKSSSSN